MASQFNLNATKRENLGKRAAKRYRKDNLVPAEVYGEKNNQSILINSFELTKQSSDPQFYSNVIDIVIDKKNIEVILKDVQRDPQKSNITHIDFLAVNKNKKIAVNVPIKFINEDSCVGIKISGGIISHIITEIEVSCLPGDIPESLEVDVANLDINQSLRITDVKLPKGVDFVHGGEDKEHDTAIVKCYKPAEEVIEDEVEQTEASAEVAADESNDDKSKEVKDEKETKE